jgi:hypothetical protein
MCKLNELPQRDKENDKNYQQMMDNGLVTKLHLGNFYVPYGPEKAQCQLYRAVEKSMLTPPKYPLC